ncbi:MAG: hypothetical protein MR902_03525 [Campylobacter sp.]|nr:hypothetical protein [Campylobacter sp.]
MADNVKFGDETSLTTLNQNGIIVKNSQASTEISSDGIKITGKNGKADPAITADA